MAEYSLSDKIIYNPTGNIGIDDILERICSLGARHKYVKCGYHGHVYDFPDKCVSCEKIADRWLDQSISFEDFTCKDLKLILELQEYGKAYFPDSKYENCMSERIVEEIYKRSLPDTENLSLIEVAQAYSYEKNNLGKVSPDLYDIFEKKMKAFIAGKEHIEPSLYNVTFLASRQDIFKDFDYNNFDKNMRISAVEGEFLEHSEYLSTLQDAKTLGKALSIAQKYEAHEKILDEILSRIEQKSERDIKSRFQEEKINSKYEELRRKYNLDEVEQKSEYTHHVIKEMSEYLDKKYARIVADGQSDGMPKSLFMECFCRYELHLEEKDYADLANIRKNARQVNECRSATENFAEVYGDLAYREICQSFPQKLFSDDTIDLMKVYKHCEREKCNSLFMCTFIRSTENYLNGKIERQTVHDWYLHDHFYQGALKDFYKTKLSKNILDKNVRKLDIKMLKWMQHQIQGGVSYNDFWQDYHDDETLIFIAEKVGKYSGEKYAKDVAQSLKTYVEKHNQTPEKKELVSNEDYVNNLFNTAYPISNQTRKCIEEKLRGHKKSNATRMVELLQNLKVNG